MTSKNNRSQRSATLVWFTSLFSILTFSYVYAGWHIESLFSTSWAIWVVRMLTAALFALMLLLVTFSLRRVDSPFVRQLVFVAYLGFGFYTSAAFFLIPAHGVLLLFPEAAATARATAVGLTVGLQVWGLREAIRTPRVKRVFIRHPRVRKRLTLVQLSDVHVGPTIRRAFVERVVKRVNGLSPDLVVLTGDLVDGTPFHLRDHVEPLAHVSAPLGRFFVTGNHDYYSGVVGWIHVVRSLGWTVLVNEHRVLCDGELVVAGTTDASAEAFHPSHRCDPQRALAQAPVEAFRLLLTHQPSSAPEGVAAGADLILAGHTHGGQYFPWTIFIRFFTKYTSGIFRIGESFLYVSRGTGYWGPPQRAGSPTEITFIELVPETSPK